MNILGPNTNASVELLQPRCIVCCGEDAGDLLHLLPTIQMYHEYRSYRFWRLPGFTLVLSGMGTGCVEPLIWEMTRPKVVRELVLIGTAGKMPGAAAPLGEPHVIDRAYLAGTGLDGENLVEPLLPRWDKPLGSIPSASSVSTDFFYGFAPRILTGGYPLAGGRLRALYEKYSNTVDLIDMEVGPFYAFCAAFGDESLRYIAIKGPSNVLGADEQQIAETPAVLKRCWETARVVLELAD